MLSLTPSITSTLLRWQSKPIICNKKPGCHT